MKRNPSIELWRIFCMFAVVLGHVLVNNGVCSMNGFFWHIPGFLIITGFFGAKFNIKKVLYLLLVCYACYWMTIPFRGVGSLISLALPHGGWFVPFYLVLLALTPLMNAALENEKAHKAIGISLIALALYNWIPRFTNNPHAGMLNIEGMWGSGVFFILVIYILARLFSIYKVCDKLRLSIWGGGICVTYRS